MPTETVPHASTTADRLQVLLTQYQGKCASLEATIAILREQAQAQAQSNGHQVIANALALTGKRRGRPPTVVAPGVLPPEDAPAAPPRHVQYTKGGPTDIRLQTERFLSQFDRTRPLKKGDVQGRTAGRLGSLLRSGYLKKVAGGYLRTAKRYYTRQWEDPKVRAAQAKYMAKFQAKRAAPAPKPRRTPARPSVQGGGRSKADLTIQRAASAARLAHFDETPREMPADMGRFIGPLVRRGYLQKVGDNLYTRTEKAFTP